jgi:hypothetical protein
MKKYIVILMVFAFAFSVQAASKDDFVVSVIHNNYPIREFKNQVTLPFNEEYKLLLKNYHSRKAVAKIFIDGMEVSKLGDIIIPSKDEVTLERFLDSSLTEGKKFKFVPISNSEVSDPRSPKNGIVRVEFRLAKRALQYLNISDPVWTPFDKYILIPNTYSSTTMDVSGSLMNTTTVNTSVSNQGATIGGSSSSQQFVQTHVEVEDALVVIELKLVGITQNAFMEINK